MPKLNRSHVFRNLRKKHAFLIYESLNIQYEPGRINIQFEFNLSDDHVFRPQISMPVPPSLAETINEEEIRNLAFHIGMVELISYWKVACPPEVIIRPYHLNEHQVEWWKKQWYHGLGEFFYSNGIETSREDFLKVTPTGQTQPPALDFKPDERVLIPVGGGKDSVVTLELISRAGVKVVPFILNPREASLRSALQAGFAKTEVFRMTRTLDPELLRLNDRGYLNGHTPFSALLAFVALLAARINGIGHIALSNESSANEPTIPGTKINHQYSKTLDFEQDFRKYVQRNICPEFNYFSFLRPLSELRIAGLFSEFPHHFSTFRSCNVGSKTDTWCGKCPKCLFTRIILGPFIDAETLQTIFGAELLDDMSLQGSFDELTGTAAEKPFECVGTLDEVNAAIREITRKHGPDNLPALLRHYAKHKKITGASFETLMQQYDSRNFLPHKFEEILKSARS